MDNKEYNGYTNWATWNVALWLDNEEYTYKQVEHMSRTALDADDLAKSLCAEFNGSEFFADMEAGDWKDVDWDSLGEQYFEEWNND